jgi:phospholipid/cholesterol/gamma-HCH transport system substrate-binding protein
LQVRVGLFVLFSVFAVVAMVFHFGELARLWEPKYPLVVHFDAAPGVYPGTPVRRNGIAVGTVEEVAFDEQRGGVLVLLAMDAECRLRRDAQPRIVRSILGDSTVDFLPGSSPEWLADGAQVDGQTPPEPMEVVERMEANVTASLVSFEQTSAEWRKVGEQLNGLMDTNRGQLHLVIERTAVSLEEFTQAMRHAQTTLANVNGVLGDPAAQEALHKALASLPVMVEETRQAIAAVRTAVVKADANLENLQAVTEPLGKRTASIATRLDNTLANLEAVSQEVNHLAKLAAHEDGTIRRFATDPALYQNLNQTAESLAVLMQNVEPILRDVRIFSDRVARHPEILGISGAMVPSSGVKVPAEPEPRQSILPNGVSRN